MKTHLVLCAKLDFFIFYFFSCPLHNKSLSQAFVSREEDESLGSLFTQIIDWLTCVYLLQTGAMN